MGSAKVAFRVSSVCVVAKCGIPAASARLPFTGGFAFFELGHKSLRVRSFCSRSRSPSHPPLIANVALCPSSVVAGCDSQPARRAARCLYAYSPHPASRDAIAAIIDMSPSFLASASGCRVGSSVGAPLGMCVGEALGAGVGGVGVGPGVGCGVGGAGVGLGVGSFVSATMELGSPILLASCMVRR